MDGLTSGNGAVAGASSAPGTGSPQAPGTTSSGEVSSPQQSSEWTGYGHNTTVCSLRRQVGSQRRHNQRREAKKPNLFESPEFRNVQAQWQRQIAQERKGRRAVGAAVAPDAAGESA